MQVTTIGLDLAKNVFQVHGITKTGEVAFNRALRRSQLLAFFSRLEPCLVGMEACATSQHWYRELTAIGHNVRLIPPSYVKPYVKRRKSDAADAEAICEAVARPNMRFVTLNARHVGHDRATLANRAILYENARAQNPERWSGQTRNWQPAGPVWLNPENETSASEIRDAA